MARGVRITHTGKLSLFTWFLGLAAAAAPASGSSQVVERSASFSCCSPAIQFSQGCDTTCTVHGTTIAYSTGTNSACKSPCRKMEGGEMTLETCIDVNVTTVCREIDVTVEKRIYYLSHTCPGSRSGVAARLGRAAAVLLLPLLTIC